MPEPNRTVEINIGEEFSSLCLQILAENRTSEEWAATESDDEFQTDSFSGGYDADEEAFCFSFYDDFGNEFWFQLSLDELKEIAEHSRTRLSIRPAE